MEWGQRRPQYFTNLKTTTHFFVWLVGFPVSVPQLLLPSYKVVTTSRPNRGVLLGDSQVDTTLVLLVLHSLTTQIRGKESGTRRAHNSKLINFRRLNNDFKINLIKPMLTESSLGGLSASPAGKDGYQHNLGVQAGRGYTCSGESQHHVHKPLVRS